jgi:hypothetical protein
MWSWSFVFSVLALFRKLSTSLFDSSFSLLDTSASLLNALEVLVFAFAARPLLGVFFFLELESLLSGQFRDTWPCLLQWKQRPSLHWVSGSGLVVPVRPWVLWNLDLDLALVSMASDLLGISTFD